MADQGLLSVNNLDGLAKLQTALAHEVLPIVAGDVMTIPAGLDYPRHAINTSAAPLKYLSISTQLTGRYCRIATRWPASFGRQPQARSLRALRSQHPPHLEACPSASFGGYSQVARRLGQ